MQLYKSFFLEEHVSQQHFRGRCKGGALVIPALVKHPSDALYPFIHFTVFVVRREARCRFCKAVFPQGEARGRPRLHGLLRLYGQIGERRTRGKCVFGRDGNTHDFVCDKLVGEKLNWRVVVARRDQGVLRMCVHKLGESRVDEAYALIFGHLERSVVIVRVIPFRRTKPSTTGVTLAVDWPMSITNAEPFPAAKLEEVFP